MDFFKQIVFDMLPKIVEPDNVKITRQYHNPLNPYNGKASLGDRLKQIAPVRLKECLSHCQVKLFKTDICPRMTHIPVLQ